MTQPVVLVILDGFGARDGGDDNAIALAKTPHWDRFISRYPVTTLKASGHYVGLPDDQFGNSEVGHLNLGAGRIVEQDIVRIDRAIHHNQLETHPLFASLDIPEHSAIHIMGLLSDGGVHSHERHIHALVELACQRSSHVYLHAFLDGRDTPPFSAALYLDKIDRLRQRFPQMRLASLCGRYYAMDRDTRWERIERAYRLLTEGKGEAFSSWQQALANHRESDEFLDPVVLSGFCPIRAGDVVWFANFRADRARQLTQAFRDPEFKHFRRDFLPLKQWLTMTRYRDDDMDPPLFDAQCLNGTLGALVAECGLKQLRIAETEKYPHVTYFFSGGREEAFEGEERILVPSPKVATYDLQPEMSAHTVCARLVDTLLNQSHSLVVCNFANADMVGHTGSLSAAIAAVEVLDVCMGKVVSTALSVGYEVMITADHGNCERMYDQEHGQVHTQHTFEPIPFLYIGKKERGLRGEGSLQDVAPTVLHAMGIEQPSEMTGQSLLI